MSTRCRIGIKNVDGSVRSIYCHHDGYVLGVGRMLNMSYSNSEIINKLLDFGDISSLEDNLESTYHESYKSRGETDVDSHVDHCVTDYVNSTKDIRYLFDDGHWYIYESDVPVLVKTGQ